MKYATGSETLRRCSVRLVYRNGETDVWIAVTVKPGFQWVPPGIRGSREGALKFCKLASFLSLSLSLPPDDLHNVPHYPVVILSLPLKVLSPLQV